MKIQNILVFSTAEWNHPFWTNKQHVAKTLSDLGYKVLYVDTVGLRKPEATTSDLKRIVKRIKESFFFLRKVRNNIWVITPWVLPYHQSSIVQWINKKLLNFQLLLCALIVGVRFETLLTYNPLTPLFLDISEYDNAIYHCVDDIKSQPEMPIDLIKEQESKLSKTADAVFTTSPNLYKIHKQQNKKTFFQPNVADFYHFNTATQDDLVVPKELQVLKNKVIGFIGAISSYKLDFRLIQSVATQRPNLNFVFIGQIGEGDSSTDISLLEDISNILFLGPRPYKQLPNYLKGMDVTILPNLINDYTRSMFPMKFFEYLAAGKPIVSTPLPALEEYYDLIYVAENSDQFANSIDSALADEKDNYENRLYIASSHTYVSRTKEMLNILETV